MTNNNNKYNPKERKKRGKKIFGGNTMDHGSKRFPFEYFAVDWATGVKPREKSVLLAIMAANSFDRELNHEPAFITQTELGARLGIVQTAVSHSIARLKKLKFICPFCLDKSVAKEGYIKTEKAEKATPDYPKGTNLTWTDGYKDVVNHLAGHYSEYVKKYGAKRGQFYFVQFRDEWTHRKRKGLDVQGKWLDVMREQFDNPIKEELEETSWDEWD